MLRPSAQIASSTGNHTPPLGESNILSPNISSNPPRRCGVRGVGRRGRQVRSTSVLVWLQALLRESGHVSLRLIECLHGFGSGLWTKYRDPAVPQVTGPEGCLPQDCDIRQPRYPY